MISIGIERDTGGKNNLVAYVPGHQFKCVLASSKNRQPNAEHLYDMDSAQARRIAEDLLFLADVLEAKRVFETMSRLEM